MDIIGAIRAEISKRIRTIDTLNHELAGFNAALEALDRKPKESAKQAAVKPKPKTTTSTKAKKTLHWTQRPENRKIVEARINKMRRANLQKSKTNLREFPKKAA